MFERTFAAVYWTAATAAAGWLAWLCFANMPWLMAAFVLPLLLLLASFAALPVIAAASAVVAGAAAAATAFIRFVRQRAA